MSFAGFFKRKHDQEGQKRSLMEIILFILLCIGFLALVIFLGILLWQRLASTNSIAKILPADTTVSVMTVRFQNDDASPSSLLKRLDREDSFSAAFFEQLETQTRVSTQEYFLPYVGGNLSVASLYDNGQLSTFLFFEVKNKEQLLGYFSSIQLEENTFETSSLGGGMTMYSYSLGYPWTVLFVDKYLVIAPDDVSMELLETAMLKGDPLEQSEDFKQAMQYVQDRSDFWAYVSLPLLREGAFRDEALFSSIRDAEIFLKPFTAPFRVFMAQGNMEAHRINYKAVALGNSDLLKPLVSRVKLPRSYEALGNHDQFMFMLSVQDIYQSIETMEEYLVGISKPLGMLFRSFAEEMEYRILGITVLKGTERYLTDQVTLVGYIDPVTLDLSIGGIVDFIPRPEKEYQELFSLVRDHLYGYLALVEVPRTLDDGSIVRELVPENQSLTMSETTLGNKTVSVLEHDGNGQSFYYVWDDHTVLFALGNQAAMEAILEVYETQPSSEKIKPSTVQFGFHMSHWIALMQIQDSSEEEVGVLTLLRNLGVVHGGIHVFDDGILLEGVIE